MKRLLVIVINAVFIISIIAWFLAEDPVHVKIAVSVALAMIFIKTFVRKK